MARSVVHTPSGSLEGKQQKRGLVFRGIPFASPPVGPGRFRAPESMPIWHGVRQATHFGPSAQQTPQTLLAARRLLGTYDDNSEDCLYLNVWTPAADNRPRPVMVWVHGGAFLLGSGSTDLYSGSRLSQRGDVVVVSANYRLGVLGSLNMEALRDRPDEIEPNLGIKDQIAALQWVRENIACFGGDPENVTIFGESAGAMSVGTLLGTPAAEGLFHRAILQSGAASNVSEHEISERVGRAFLRYVGLPRANPAQLRRVPVGRLLTAQTATTRELSVGVANLPWQPAIDGQLLCEQPLQRIRTSGKVPVPVLMGSNQDEWALFMLPDSSGRKLDEAGLERRILRVLAANDIDPNLLHRFQETYGQSLGAPRYRWSQFMSDLVFHAPAGILADTLSRAGGEVYFYRFDGQLPLVGPYTGAFHGLEIPYVFGTVRKGPLAATMGWSSDVRTLSRRMQTAWARFAHGQVPGHEGLPVWPRWDPASRQALRLAPKPGVLEDPHAKARQLWNPLLAQTPVLSAIETQASRVARE
jgi:para-nitrobenzyl esterase